jgi:hypothetical protein
MQTIGMRLAEASASGNPSPEDRQAESTDANGPLFFLGALQDLYIPFCSLHANSLPILNQLGNVFYSDNCR